MCSGSVLFPPRVKKNTGILSNHHPFSNFLRQGSEKMNPVLQSIRNESYNIFTVFHYVHQVHDKMLIISLITEVCNDQEVTT